MTNNDDEYLEFAELNEDRVENLENEITQLRKELLECQQDSILLDYLDNLPGILPGYGWKLYRSFGDQCWRLAVVRPNTMAIMDQTQDVYATPREAIRAEINLEIQLEEKETED